MKRLVGIELLVAIAGALLLAALLFYFDAKTNPLRGASLFAVGCAIFVIPLAISWGALQALVKVKMSMLGFAVAQSLKILLVLVGLVLAGAFLRKDFVWVLAGFIPATATYFFVMRKS